MSASRNLVRRRDHSHTLRMERLETDIAETAGLIPERPAPGKPIVWHLLHPRVELSCRKPMPDGVTLRRINPLAPRVSRDNVCKGCLENSPQWRPAGIDAWTLDEMMAAANRLLDREARTGTQPGRRNLPGGLAADHSRVRE